MQRPAKCGERGLVDGFADGRVGPGSSLALLPTRAADRANGQAAKTRGRRNASA